eukprot:13898_4
MKAARYVTAVRVHSTCSDGNIIVVYADKYFAQNVSWKYQLILKTKSISRAEPTATKSSASFVKTNLSNIRRMPNKKTRKPSS